MESNPNVKYWQEIWANFKAGDRRAFESIYNEFVDVLYSYGSKITSDKVLLEDSIQDLFIDVYRYGSSIRQPEYLEFYLFKSLKRIIIRKLKEKSKTLEFTNESFEQFNLTFSIEEISDKEILEKNILLLQNEIKSLDAQKRELLFLKFNSGLTYTEIGEMLNLKPDTVKKQVQRLLKHIQNRLGGTMIEFVLTFRVL
ncbi:RNA polymerase sigma factor [Mangrovibacterium sp.]|uniref:RNA polymerase sigma factor n=1 Tax=Mangrovibacterium sp. TaxID=1961364 RepID=UPI0035634B8A